MSIITTAGKDLTYPCFTQEYDYCAKLLDPDVDVFNDEYFVDLRGGSGMISAHKIPEESQSDSSILSRGIAENPGRIMRLPDRFRKS